MSYAFDACWYHRNVSWRTHASVLTRSITKPAVLYKLEMSCARRIQIRARSLPGCSGSIGGFRDRRDVPRHFGGPLKMLGDFCMVDNQNRPQNRFWGEPFVCAKKTLLLGELWASQKASARNHNATGRFWDSNRPGWCHAHTCTGGPKVNPVHCVRIN